ncbi:STAS domain-containing protein [Actinophytocola sp.]|uniref:STAS domain-containing protein n=1 Tax=Actinophytocola sp. TaxID=1872138 RepID=UPI002D80E741|nr:STAS domain-containing protein [Actinophytocola sp.]HET9138833.1 STAS domain-containing protein [Actinophytocola sp.]
MIELDTGFGDDAAVIRPQGRLTMVTAPQLRSLVLHAVEEQRVRVVVDLSQTEFMDSSGLGALIAGLKATRQAGGDLRIACMGPQVATIIQLANLDRVLRPYDSVAEALQ